MIAPPERAPAFQRPKVGHILHHADHALVPPRHLANGAGLHGVIVSADMAFLDLRAGVRHRLGQRFQQRVIALEQMQRHPPRRPWPQARQLGDQIDQSEKFRAGRTL